MTMRIKWSFVLLPVLLLGAVFSASAQLVPLTPTTAQWPQWGQNPQHTGFVRWEGQSPTKQLAQITYDPFVPQEQIESGRGDLLGRYLHLSNNGPVHHSKCPQQKRLRC